MCSKEDYWVYGNETIIDKFNSMNIQWEGVFPALTTSFTKEDNIDLLMLEKKLYAQLEAGVQGIIVGGTLGEAGVLRMNEKQKLIENTVEILGGKLPVIVNIAESVTSEAIKQAILAAGWGANGLMLLPPMRYKSDQRETVAYFKAVAHAVDLPIMIYNNPVDYKTEITLSMFEELTACKNIQAVKESTRDVTNVTRMINLFGDRFKILCGVDTIAMEELVLGADGWVAGLVCAFPKETLAIYQLVKAGRLEEAQKIYRWFMPLLELDIHPKLVQYIKLCETLVGLGSEYVRSPRLTVIGGERENLLNIINKSLANRPDLSPLFLKSLV